VNRSRPVVQRLKAQFVFSRAKILVLLFATTAAMLCAVLVTVDGGSRARAATSTSASGVVLVPAAYGSGLGIDNDGDVLVPAQSGSSQTGGIWNATTGAFTPSPNPGTFGLPVLAAINDDGLVVGSLVPESSTDAPVAYEWDTTTGKTYLPPMTYNGVECPNQLAEDTYFDAVEQDGDEAAGTGIDPSCGSASNAQVFGGITTADPDDDAVVDLSVYNIYAIQGDYELVESEEDGQQYIRQISTGDLVANKLGANTYESLNSQGILVGQDPATNMPAVELPNGTVHDLAVPAGGKSGTANAINASGEIVGDVAGVTGGGVIWSSYTGQPQSLASLVGTGTGFDSGIPQYVSGDGMLLGEGEYGGTERWFVYDPGTLVSGTVNAQHCDETSCSQEGLEGVVMLATGTSSDGQSVDQSTDTLSDGTWSLSLPPGTYKIGPSENGGDTIDGTGFDPESTSLTVGSTPITGVNFSACTVDPATEVDDVRRGHARGRVASADSSSVAPSACQSIYTVKLIASIPQSQIVDPSTAARYQTDEGAGYNTSPAGFTGQHNYVVRSLTGLALEYPACFSAAAVKRDTKERAYASWYSYLKGGSLGSATASFAWNRSTQQVKVVSGPTVATARLTRVFKWRMVIHHKVQTGTCNEVSRVPVEVFPVGGTDVAGKPSNQFTMIVAWPIPFQPSGVNLDVESALTQKAVEKIEAFDEGIEGIFKAFGESYEHAPEPLKFGIQLGLLTFGEAKLVGAIGKSAAALEAAEWNFSASVFSAIHEGSEVAHYAKFAQETTQELFNLFGAFGKGYPMISTVIRGHFQTNYATQNNQYVLYNGNKVAYQSILGLSVSAPKFPDILLTVSRSAAATTDGTSQPFDGQLPWSGNPSGVDTVNPFAAQHPNNLISDVDDEHYDRGKEAVKEIAEQAEANPAVEKGLEINGNLVTDFKAEQSSVPLPSCTTNATVTKANPTSGEPLSASTICWTMTDTRP
jgi:hypothetical protein